MLSINIAATFTLYAIKLEAVRKPVGEYLLPAGHACMHAHADGQV